MTTITELTEITVQIGEAGKKEKLRDYLAHAEMGMGRIVLSPRFAPWILALYKEKKESTATGLHMFCLWGAGLKGERWVAF